ncbi:hypothetical protein L0664_16515 [Octadecabacter sp. G9-8]|uniref:Uncharacterized protein n=1 Tax=Octadecabacter dasysiphoniae TaxID=2909341 RepID=A0ABS9D0V4_9RHOB|nr:hypothetical protein [Octadecabacter dasysiphoniae]MCF2872677.1 hypothetical protein [Octadecabacter dasysiphoniae]
MSLKDLVADASKLTEEAIEGIVTDFVRYDPTAQVVVFTPLGGELGNEQKILVYLVALLGWKFVIDDPKAVSTKPADLERELGIHGGTLRPVLKKLKDGHLVSAPEGHYQVQSANLDSVAQVVNGGKVATKNRSKGSTQPKKKPVAQNDASKPNAKEQVAKKVKGSVGDLRGKLEEWIAEGYFDEAKTIGDVESRFHEKAIIAKQSSLSGLLLRVVRDGLLERKKRDVNGKLLWTYSK